MPQLVLHGYERIAYALGGVGATEPVRREVVLSWQARPDLLDVEQMPWRTGTEGSPIRTEEKHPDRMTEHYWTALLGKPAQRGCGAWQTLKEPATEPFACRNPNQRAPQNG